MTTAEYKITNFPATDPTPYKGQLDANSAVVARLAAAFQCYAASPEDMTVKVAAGGLMVNDALTEKAIQTSGTITAPVTHPRIDRVVVDQITGVASIITGAEAASPSAPAITAGKLPVAQIALTTSTTAITNSLITDERGAIFFLSINGLAEDTTPDLAADYALAWDASAGAMKKVLLGNIGSNEDSWARDNILLLFLRDSITSGIASGAMRDGVSDAFLTDTIGGTSTNESYDSGGKYYHNPANAGGVYALTAGMLSQSGLNSFDAAKCVDGNTGTNCFYCDTSAVGSYLMIDLGAGISVQFEKFRAYTTGAVNAIFDVEYSDNGSSWTAAATGLDLSGTAGWNQITWTGATAGAHRYWRIYKTNAASSGNWVSEIEMTASATAALDMTLIPAAATALSAPTSGRIVVLHKAVDAVTYNTDFTAEMTRDGGTTYTAITLADAGAYDADYRILEGTVDVSAQPSGTSIKYRLKTLNNKTQRVKGVALSWG